MRRTSSTTTRPIALLAPRRALSVAMASALLVVSATSASAVTLGPDAPHLRLHAGEIAVDAGRLVGSFVVINSGAATSPRGAAAVVIETGGRQRLLARLSRPPIPLGAAERIRVDAAVPAHLPPGTWPLLACAERRHPSGRPARWAVCRSVGTLHAEAAGAS